MTSELDPSFVIANNLLAVVYTQAGKPYEAMAQWEKVQDQSLRI